MLVEHQHLQFAHRFDGFDQSEETSRGLLILHHEGIQLLRQSDHIGRQGPRELVIAQRHR